MNLTAVIISSVFAVLGAGAFLFFLMGKNKFTASHARNYYRASAGVYLSAVILLFVLSLVMTGLPTEFIIIAEAMLAFVFVFSTYILHRIILQLDNIQKDINEGRVRSSEQVEREDAEFANRFADEKESEDSEEDN